MQEGLDVSRRTWVIIIPGQPFFRVFDKVSRVFWKCCKIIKGINTSQIAGMDKAHEQISNTRTIFSFIKQCVFAMEDGFFKSPFADIVIKGRLWHPQKESQRFPVVKHIYEMA